MAKKKDEKAKKDEVKKKRPRKRRKKKNLIPAVGTNDFVSAAEALTKSSAELMNCFARYFIERTLAEIKILSIQGIATAPVDTDAFYVSHKLPMPEMHLFPLYNIDYPEIHEIIPLSNNKQSYLMTRIADLSKQMATRLDTIAEEDGIPLPSIYRILSIMVGRPPGMCSDPFAPSLEKADITTRTSPVQYYDSVFIPNEILLTWRDTFLIEISHRIHGLLTEAFIVLMLAGFSDLNDIQDLKSQGAKISNLKYAMWQMACCTWLEMQLSKINTFEELDACIGKEFSKFQNAYVPIILYINDRIFKLASPYASRLKDDDDIPTGQAVSEDYTEDMHPSTKSTFKSLARSKPNVGKQSKKKVSEIRIMEFEAEILNMVKKKITNKPWKQYKLTGDLDNIRNFIYVIVRNCCNKIIEKEVKRIPGLDMSFRTHRRDNRALRSGALDEFLKMINKLGTIKRVKDMSDAERELYKKYKADRVKHRKEGYLTQNQLIEYLRDDEEIAKLNQKGISLKRYSVPTLRKKIKMLVEAGKISYEVNDKGTFHYKEEDKEHIARFIADL